MIDWRVGFHPDLTRARWNAGTRWNASLQRTAWKASLQVVLISGSSSSHAPCFLETGADELDYCFIYRLALAPRQSYHVKHHLVQENG